MATCHYLQCLNYNLKTKIMQEGQGLNSFSPFLFYPSLPPSLPPFLTISPPLRPSLFPFLPLSYFPSLPFSSLSSEYKGHYVIKCSQKCSIAFHPTCWKKQKNSLCFNSDRAVLSQHCLTPNCNGKVTHIIQYDHTEKIKVYRCYFVILSSFAWALTGILFLVTSFGLFVLNLEARVHV